MTKYYATFVVNCSLHNKLLNLGETTFTNANNLARRYYEDAIADIVTEYDLASMPYGNFTVVNLGTACELFNENSDIVKVYPIGQKQGFYVDHIIDWFNIAKPHPTNKDISSQLGAHFEECGEMTEALEIIDTTSEVTIELKRCSKYFYQNELPEIINYIKENRQARIDLLDALADQIVTAVGVANYLGMDIKGALAEVNRANYSKFENGKPVLNTDGKIIKGKNYKAPELADFI